MSVYSDLGDVPEDLRPCVDDPTTDEVRLWRDGGGTLYIESSDYPLVVGGVECVIGSSTFRADAQEWPCWINHSAGVHYIGKDDWDGFTEQPEVSHIATYHQGAVRVVDPIRGDNARAYLGSDHRDIMANRLTA